MNAFPLSRWTLTVAAIAAGSLACGVGQEGSDPTLVSYDEPLTAAPPSGQPTCADAKKVLICHIPPGNPANAHSICVGAPAQPAHLAHGDVLGACSTDSGGGSGGEDADAGSGGGTDADAGTPTTDDGGTIL